MSTLHSAFAALLLALAATLMLRPESPVEPSVRLSHFNVRSESRTAVSAHIELDRSGALLIDGLPVTHARAADWIRGTHRLRGEFRDVLVRVHPEASTGSFLALAELVESVGGTLIAVE